MSPASSTIIAKSHSGTTFTFFPKLPPELRVKIWEYALPAGPRVLKVYYEGWQTPGPKFKIRAEGSYPATPLLLVSVEARTVARKAYPFRSFNLKPVHFNFERDILYFCGPRALEYFIWRARACDKHPKGWEMKKIRYVAYTGPLLEPYQILSERGLRMFTGLRTLKFPHHPSPDVPQIRVQEYQQQVEGDLNRVWAEMRELEGIKTPMAGQEFEVQWMTRDEWNLTVTDTEEYIWEF